MWRPRAVRDRRANLVPPSVGSSSQRVSRRSRNGQRSAEIRREPKETRCSAALDTNQRRVTCSWRRSPSLSTIVVGLSATAAASASVEHRGTDNDHNVHGPKPTIVLVHGGWADASSWDAVAQRLEEDGYTVIAPVNPLRGVQSDSAYLASVLATISGPIVLVGHSYGGVLITNAAAGNPNVKALVVHRGVRPRPGRDRRSDLGNEPRQPGRAPNLTSRPSPGGVDVYISPSAFRGVFCADLPADTAAVMAATQRPIEAAALGEPSGEPRGRRLRRGIWWRTTITPSRRRRSDSWPSGLARPPLRSRRRTSP